MSDADESTYSAVRTVLGTTRRASCWYLNDEVDVLTILGRSVFDLRCVETTGGEVVEIAVNCVFGMVDFIVPGGTMVVLDGTSFLAGARSDVSDDGEHEGPRIEITALTVLGRTRVFSPGSQAIELDDAELEESAAAAVVEAPAETAETDADPAEAEPDTEALAADGWSGDGESGEAPEADSEEPAAELAEAATT